MKRTHLRPRSFALALLALLPALASGCAPTHRTRTEAVSAPLGAIPDRGYDLEHYRIEVDLLPEERRIEGRCTVTLTATRPDLGEVVLDLVGLAVSGVHDRDGGELGFVHTDGLLRIAPRMPLAQGERFDVRVSYGGTPRTGLWFSGRRADGTGPSQVFTQGESNHSRGWFPCFDHPSDRVTSEVIVTMPSDWVSVAPGERLSSDVEGFLKTEHWRIDQTHPTYLTSLVAGELVVRESSWQGTPLYFVGEQRFEPWFEASFHETDEILSFFSEYTGVRYPYPKYSQAVVDNFPWGGMENISATTLTPLTLDDERGNRDNTSHGLVAHEAAHQWFGNLITCNDWAHIWLNEGFATYMTQLYFEETRGPDFFRARMRDSQEEYIAEERRRGRRATVSASFKEPEDLFDTRSYQGAAARLHLLRFLVGDQAFRRGVRAYVSRFQGQNAVTADLQSVLEEATGHDLDTFFEQWIYGAGFPELELDWRYEPRKQRIVLDVNQVHDSYDGAAHAFRVPVDVEVHDSRGKTTHRIQLSEREESFVLPAEERPFYVQFDKYGWIPKTVEYRRREAAEWLAIITADDDVNARREAAHALGRIAADSRNGDAPAHGVYVAELANTLQRDSSPWVRADAATALGVAGGLEARERLALASGTDAEARVRVAALQALWGWGRSPDLAALGRRRFEEGYSWQTMGAAAGLVVRADPENAYEWITEKLLLDSPHDQLAGLLLQHLGTIDAKVVSAQLLRWAQDDALHPTARGVALRELAKRNRGRADVAREVATFLDEESFRLRQAAIEALAEIGEPRSREALRAYYPRSQTQRERRGIEAALAAAGGR